MKQAALVLGASGLVGGECLKILLDEESFGAVHALVRRPLAVDHPKLDQHIISYEDLVENSPSWPSADAVFCCLGTTIKKAGSQKAFRRVDHDYPLAAARRAARNNKARFLVISSLGAHPDSRIFYNRIKGETERALGNLGLHHLVILRPSLIVGDRKEQRTGEKIAGVLMAPLSGMMVGALRKYRPIQATTIARAMVRMSLKESTGITILESDRIQELGKE